MEFKEALLKVGQSCLHIYNMIDPFFLYSHLSDYSRSTLEKKDKIKLYYKMLQVVNFYEYILLNGIDEGKKMIEDRYYRVANILTLEDYLFFLEATIEVILKTQILNEYMQSNLDKKVVYPYVLKELPADTIYYKKHKSSYIHLNPNCSELQNSKTIYQKILPLASKMKVCKECANSQILHKEGQEHRFLKLVDALFKTDYNTTKITKFKKEDKI